MLHIRELHYLQLLPQDLLCQATSLGGGRVIPCRHEELGTLYCSKQGPLLLTHQSSQAGHQEEEDGGEFGGEERQEETSQIRVGPSQHAITDTNQSRTSLLLPNIT